MMDLTTLEGKDTQGKVRELCAKAMRPIRATRRFPRRGRLRLPEPRRVARRALAGSGVKVASVATAFPPARRRSR